MLAQLSAQYTVRPHFWTAFKAAFAARGGILQAEPDVDAAPTMYTVWFYDSPDCFVARLWKPQFDTSVPPNELTTVPDDQIAAGYTQAQNDLDWADFTTNFLPTANGILQPKAADGRQDVRVTAASKARNFNLRVFSVMTGDASTLKNFDSKFNTLTDVTVTCYDVNGAVTTTPANAVTTVLDLEPTFNYEVIGGWIDTPTSLVGGSTGQWWVSCVGVPDIPAAYGGSVNFVYPVNLELVYTQKIVSDGRASQYLTYSPTMHTNKLRWIVKHPPGASEPVQIYVETFV